MHWCSCLLIAESPVIYCLYVSGGDSGDVAINNMSHLWTHRSFLLVSSRGFGKGKKGQETPVESPDKFMNVKHLSSVS